MYSSVKREDHTISETHPLREVRKPFLSKFVCSVLASIGIFGGISALFAGLICVVIHALLSGDRAFDSVGTVLLIAAIPMILAGSVFLDMIEAKK